MTGPTMGIPNNPKLYSHPISLVSLLKKFSGSDNSALGILEPIVAHLLVCHRGGRPTKAMRHRVVSIRYANLYCMKINCAYMFYGSLIYIFLY
jgi:hypothetical protein